MDLIIHIMFQGNNRITFHLVNHITENSSSDCGGMDCLMDTFLLIFDLSYLTSFQKSYKHYDFIKSLFKNPICSIEHFQISFTHHKVFITISSCFVL